MVKLNSTGVIEWQKCLGGSGYDESYFIRQTSDSGYIVTGFTTSNDWNVSGNHGSEDFWVVKLNSTGTVLWQKCLGGSAVDDPFSIQQTADGGYVIAGGTQSNDGDVTVNHGGFDFWIVKLKSTGTIQWEKSFGGTGDEIASSVQQTIDGGYIVAGTSTSTNGDVAGNHGMDDYWVIKLNSAGTMQWQKSLGGSGQDFGYSVLQKADGSYFVSGFTRSNNGDVVGMHGTAVQGDYWLVKLNGIGNMQWQKCFGGLNADQAYDLQQINDNGFIMTGYAKSNDGDVTGNHANGLHDNWIVKTDSLGVIQWQKCLGGTNTDWGRSIKQTADGGFVVAGFTESNNGDVSGNHGKTDYWIVKLSPYVLIDTGVEEYNSTAWHVSPNPTTGLFSVTGNGQNSGAVLKILNPLGQLIYESLLNNEKASVDLSAYPAGIYFASITSENSKWLGKIIIE